MNKEEVLNMLKENMNYVLVRKEIDYSDILDIYAALIFIIGFGFGDMNTDEQK